MVGEIIRGLGEMTFKGLIANGAPGVAKGMINEYLNQISVKTIIVMVDGKIALWSLLPNEQYDAIKRMMGQVGDIDWLTVEWLFDATREKHPDIVSLFLGWPKGKNWLKRQVEDIKKQVAKLMG